MMKMIGGTQPSHLVLGFALLSIGSSALAATTWNFSTCNGTASNQSATNAGNFGNSWSCAGATGSNKVTVSAWGGANSTGSTGFQTAYASSQGGSGFGIASRSEGVSVAAPNHAADNSPTTSVTPDMFVLKFDTAVTLGEVGLGWSQSDADFSLMAYKGTVSGATVAAQMDSFIKTKNTTTLTSGGVGAGWALIQNSGDADPVSAVGYAGSSTDITRPVNSSNVSSSWWLISAYNSSYGGGSLDALPDYMKLLSVASKNTPSGKVPEPGSIALLGAGLLGLIATQKRRQKLIQLLPFRN